MDNEGIIGRPSLGCVNPLCRLAVQCISSKAIHRFRGECHQAPMANDFSQGEDFISVIVFVYFYHFCVHSFSFFLQYRARSMPP